MANMIRNISQTAQEREIVKLAPDVVVYIDGIPYQLNYFVNDANAGTSYTVVNFNNHVTSFQAAYDTDLMVPSATINLSVPNYQKYLYQMPGGNNLFQPMQQVQVYAKGYYLTNTGDTIYRRVFKGVVSHISYSDDGKMLQISLQCYGIMYMLELMQINVNPSVISGTQNATSLTIYQTKFAGMDPLRQIADAFLFAFQTDGAQLDNLTQQSVVSGAFGQAFVRGYMNKWQAILTNMIKDVHIYGVSYKDFTKDNTRGGSKVPVKTADTKGQMGKDVLADQMAHRSTLDEVDMVNDTYYSNIREFAPDRKITDVQLFNSSIINRLDLIRKNVQLVDWEGYQDVDGKIIIKPPLYNLDVTNLGPRNQKTSPNPQGQGDNANSLDNSLTAIYPQSNPFVVHLSEILTEQETEDQAGVKRTRTTVAGNIDPQFQFGYNERYLNVVEWVDVPKLARFGLREEPVVVAPWFKDGDTFTLFAHAIAETVRANRGYRTYTFTIPLRPELKLGFPVYIPHKDMYAYVKSISVSYQVGSTATMTVTCDSVRRRVLVNTPQKDANGNTYYKYTSAPNLIYVWTNNPPAQTVTAAGQSAGQDVSFFNPTANQLAIAQSTTNNSSTQNPTVQVGSPVTLANTDQNVQPTHQQLRIHAVETQKNATKLGQQTDTQFASYVVQNDGPVGGHPATADPGITVPYGPGGGYFTDKRPNGVDGQYMRDLQKGVIPYTDGKGYEVMSPFPWGRYSDLNTVIKEFTQRGWITRTMDVNGNPTTLLEDLSIQQGTDAMLFAGLGTPTASGSAAETLSNNMSTTISNTIGGTFASTAPDESTLTPDATVIVLQYPSGTTTQADSMLLNTAQPEDAIASQQINGTLSGQQQVIDVLVTGGIAPTKAVQEALITTKTALPGGKYLTLVNGKPVTQQK
jgi:hypothetical protein